MQLSLRGPLSRRPSELCRTFSSLPSIALEQLERLGFKIAQ